MKILVTEQQYSKLMDLYKELIKNVLDQKNINVSDISVTPIFFPESGIQIDVKLKFNHDKPLAKDLIKGIIGNLSSFGPKKVLKITS
jgi:predicted RNase H-related nuclease YkuK (DUF458 family)